MKRAGLYIIIFILIVTVLPVPGIDSFFPGFWDTVSEVTGYMLSQHGFYVPLGDYHFIFWKDLGLGVLGVMALWHRAMHVMERDEKDRMQRILSTRETEPVKVKKTVPATGPDEVPWPDETSEDPVFVPSDDTIETVRVALCTCQDITIRYRNLKGIVTARTVHPIELFHRDGHSYLRGWCNLRGGERIFRVDRMSL